MKRLLTYSLIASMFCLPLSVRGQAKDSKESLANLDRKLNEAIHSGDNITVLDELLANDWQGTTALGETHSKAALLEQIRKAKSEPRKKNPPKLGVSTTEVRVHVYGDTAVVSGFLGMKSKGEEISPSRYVNVYMKRGEKWRAISTHYC